MIFVISKKNYKPFHHRLQDKFVGDGREYFLHDRQDLDVDDFWVSLPSAAGKKNVLSMKDGSRAEDEDEILSRTRNYRELTVRGHFFFVRSHFPWVTFWCIP